MPEQLTAEERRTLLEIARRSLELAVRGEKLPPLDDAALTKALREHGASFVTLTLHGDLRGCIGALEPYQALALDVREHAIAAGLEDPRFPPVRPKELAELKIEVSRLTRPTRLEYKDAADLLARLNPPVDGVILRDGWQRATFLPQVWEKLPDKADFLDNLCSKMGSAADTWRRKHLEVLTYQVEEFHE